MNTDFKKAIGWTMTLILLGIAAFYGGTRWLTIIIPAAILIWVSARPPLRSGRN